jgi:hypothetical protein
LDCLSGSDRNSVKNQLHRIIWNAATFRVINESRRLAEQDARGRPKLSGGDFSFPQANFVVVPEPAGTALVALGGIATLLRSRPRRPI